MYAGWRSVKNPKYILDQPSPARMQVRPHLHSELERPRNLGGPRPISTTSIEPGNIVRRSDRLLLARLQRQNGNYPHWFWIVLFMDMYCFLSSSNGERETGPTVSRLSRRGGKNNGRFHSMVLISAHFACLPSGWKMLCAHPGVLSHQTANSAPSHRCRRPVHRGKSTQFKVVILTECISSDHDQAHVQPFIGTADKHHCSNAPAIPVFSCWLYTRLEYPAFELTYISFALRSGYLVTIHLCIYVCI